MSPLEWAATAFGVANIALLVRRSVWNYPAGLVMVTLYGWIFWHAHLYVDFGLQIFFFIAQVVGWTAWLRHRDPGGEVVVERSTPREFLLSLLATAAAIALIGWAIARWTNDPYPFWDATIGATSVLAQILLTVRKLENWLWWIGSNVVAIAVYLKKGLYPTVGLYCLFMVMSSLGWLEWRRKLKSPTPSCAP